MGSACSMGSALVLPNKKAKDSIAKSEEIEKELMVAKKAELWTMKILLLGPGDSGKSTTLKQIRIIHDSGFSLEEKLARRFVINLNLLHGVVDVIRKVEELHLIYEMGTSANYAREILDRFDKEKTNDSMEMSNDMVESIGGLLLDSSVMFIVDRHTEFNIEDSVRYFIRNFYRICQKDYIPTEEDILKSRASTSGVLQFMFSIKNFTFKIFDVGGQRSQRRKWIHFFDDVHAVLFITSLSEYNQVMSEDASINRMDDSLELFAKICNNEWFYSTAIILFLNKIDLFAEKIKRFNITLAFPNYQGLQEYREALDYITRKFKGVANSEKYDREFFTHETCATDTNQIEVVIDNVFDLIIQKNMQNAGIQG